MRYLTYKAQEIRTEFEVIRLWEQPNEPFLELTVLLLLAVLTKTPDKPKLCVKLRLKSMQSQSSGFNLEIRSTDLEHYR